jgi:vacuolar-type H+-ATPase catalytic subunit A/Vma1
MSATARKILATINRIASPTIDATELTSDYETRYGSVVDITTRHKRLTDRKRKKREFLSSERNDVEDHLLVEPPPSESLISSAAVPSSSSHRQQQQQQKKTQPTSTLKSSTKERTVLPQPLTHLDEDQTKQYATAPTSKKRKKTDTNENEIENEKILSRKNIKGTNCRISLIHS